MIFVPVTVVIVNIVVLQDVMQCSLVSDYQRLFGSDVGPPVNRWRPLTAFPLKNLDNVSSIGSGAGIAASSRRGSTSKGTKVSDLYKYFK